MMSTIILFFITLLLLHRFVHLSIVVCITIEHIRLHNATLYQILPLFLTPLLSFFLSFFLFFFLSLNQWMNLKNRIRCTFPRCGKEFSNESRLSTHIRIHSGKPPYPCDYPGCTKAFHTVRSVLLLNFSLCCISCIALFVVLVDFFFFL